ncbi:MAG TPA: peptidase T [Solirubrobacteraceae bacterium]|nr:peptidase T [Solirubrobacteraceae bacterium]
MADDRFTSPLAEALAPGVLERFLRYVRVDTTSRIDRERCPSTPGQLELAALLRDELREVGLADAEVDENGYLFATLPASRPGLPAIGWLAHLDTSPEVSGAGVEPIVHERWDGAPIALPRGGVVIDPADSPALRGKRGEDVVTASGDTLLGADDKAGIAEVVAAVAHLAAHPELPRPEIRVGFTPDEEIGMGAALFDVERFGARCAYTVDGESLGQLQDETFTAKEVVLTVHGVDVHPGFATGKLVSALKLAGRILAALPTDGLAPETTSGREGFVHPFLIEGGTARATIRFIARDFEDELLDAHVERLLAIAREVVGAEPRARLDVEVRAQYPNMRAHLEPFPEVVAHAEAALRAEGLEPLRDPIRGGTDGSQLSAKGLPTPNLFAGGHEFHSPREWVSVQDMAAAAAVLVRLAGEWASG